MPCFSICAATVERAVKVQPLGCGLPFIRRTFMTPATCGETGDFSTWGIAHNRCIDPELILKLTGRPPDLLRLFGLSGPRQMALPGGEAASSPAPQPAYPRDPGQRPSCLCVPCKDVGQYNTCPHGCVYCYANTSPAVALRHYKRHDPQGESILPPE